MSQFARNTRSPLLRLLQRAFGLAIEQGHPKGASLAERMEIDAQQRQDFQRSRREFMLRSAKAAAGLGIGGWAASCTKPNDPLQPAETVGRSNHAAKQSPRPRIAIIGGGIAGLSCAYELKKNGFPSTIYEASDRVGGRIFTKKDFIGEGLFTECGGEFIDSRHRNMLKLAAEFNLPLIDTLSAAERELSRDSFYIDGVYYSEAEVISAFEPYAKRIATDISSLPNYFGYDDYTPNVLRLDQLSISGYFDSIGMPASLFLRKGLELAYVTEYGLEASEQTAINFLYLFYINPGNNSYDIFGISDERYKIAGGNQRIVEALYQGLQQQVVMGAALTAVTKNNADVYTLQFTGAPPASADIVVMTLPFTLLRQVDLTGLGLPSWKTGAIQNLGYGTNAKLLLGFGNRNWRNYAHSGYIFTNGSTEFSEAYIQTGWDSSQLQPVSNGSYTVFQGGQLGAALNLSQAATFLQQLDSIWPGTQAQHNGIAKLIHWPSWKWSLGSYSCWRVGQVTTIKGAEYAPVGNLFFAGEHTSSVNQGYMEGGAETGSMVAKAIAVKLY